jgi:hypothetical protein
VGLVPVQSKPALMWVLVVWWDPILLLQMPLDG